MTNLIVPVLLRMRVDYSDWRQPLVFWFGWLRWDRIHQSHHIYKGVSHLTSRGSAKAAPQVPVRLPSRMLGGPQG